MNSNVVRKIVGGLSLTSALFIFQACYGSAQDFGLDVLVEGSVTSKTTGLPVKGIKVSVAENMQYEYTNEEGRFSFYTEKLDTMNIIFEDIDSTDNGKYSTRDTTIVQNSDAIFLNIQLEEK